HVKGDPYKITEAGRLKLSNAESGILASKSKQSKASPNPVIWTLPDPSLISSPIPYTSQCGMDQTSDQTDTTQAPDVDASEKPTQRQGANVEPNTTDEVLDRGRAMAVAQHTLSAKASIAPVAPGEVLQRTQAHTVSQHQLVATNPSDTPSSIEAMSH